MLREDAYKIVQRIAMDSWVNQRNFDKLLKQDQTIFITCRKD